MLYGVKLAKLAFDANLGYVNTQHILNSQKLKLIFGELNYKSAFLLYQIFISKFYKLNRESKTCLNFEISNLDSDKIL